MQNIINYVLGFAGVDKMSPADKLFAVQTIAIFAADFRMAIGPRLSEVDTAIATNDTYWTNTVSTAYTFFVAGYVRGSQSGAK